MNLPLLITRNFRLKILATLIAIITWAGVVYAGNPPESRTITVHVVQDTSAMPAKFVLVHPIADLLLTITGTRDHVNSFNPSELRATADFRAVDHAGLQDVKVHFSPVSTVDIEDQPLTVQADIDELSAVTLPVKVVVNPPPPVGYITTSIKSTPSSVTVSGPKQELQGLEARVTLDLSQQKTNLSQDAAVVIFDASRTRLTNVSVTPATVQIDITVATTVTSRSAAIIPTITGSLPSGYELRAISMDTQVVTLIGPRDLLNTLDSVPTAGISLNGLTHDITLVRAITPLPTGVRATPGSITITLHIVAIAPTATPTPRPTPTPGPTP